MTNSQGNKDRLETRLEIEETIFIEVLSSGDQSDGNVIMCTSLDLSANGIQVVVDQDIAISSIMRICIDLPNREPIFLVAEVVWKQADDETDGYRIGFSLFESDDTNIEEWKLWVAEQLDQDLS